jgi:hypothetical protein
MVASGTMQSEPMERAMSLDPKIPADHIDGGFKWAIVPACGCELFIEAIKEKFIFVPNMVRWHR